MFFGKINVECYKYALIKKTDNYELRRYAPALFAQIRCQNKGDSDSFRALAKYIGVFGTPQNFTTEGAPKAIAMTAPVVNDSNTMKFVLPSGFTLDNAPRPTDERVELVAVPERVMLVQQYSGTTT